MALNKLALFVCASLVLAGFAIPQPAQAKPIERVRLIDGEFRTSTGVFTPRGVNLLSAACPQQQKSCFFSVPALFSDDVQLAAAIARLPWFAYEHGRIPVNDAIISESVCASL